jgi:mannose-6-phosphate isomerase-like protein (cupin superfamily)
MENKEPTRLSGVVPKGWGYELIWATNDKYCGKIMYFEKSNAKFSMHFHREKDETWFVNSGKFKVRWIDTSNAVLYEKLLNEGDVWHNPPLQPHQLICLQEGSSITEVSTADSVEDNYRVAPGDSQKTNIEPNLNPEEQDG